MLQNYPFFQGRSIKKLEVSASSIYIENLPNFDKTNCFVTVTPIMCPEANYDLEKWGKWD